MWGISSWVLQFLTQLQQILAAHSKARQTARRYCGVVLDIRQLFYGTESQVQTTHPINVAALMALVTSYDLGVAEADSIEGTCFGKAWKEKQGGEVDTLRGCTESEKMGANQRDVTSTQSQWCSYNVTEERTDRAQHHLV